MFSKYLVIYDLRNIIGIWTQSPMVLLLCLLMLAKTAITYHNFIIIYFYSYRLNLGMFIKNIRRWQTVREMNFFIFIYVNFRLTYVSLKLL